MCLCFSLNLSWCMILTRFWKAQTGSKKSQTVNIRTGLPSNFWYAKHFVGRDCLVYCSTPSSHHSAHEICFWNKCIDAHTTWGQTVWRLGLDLICWLPAGERWGKQPRLLVLPPPPNSFEAGLLHCSLCEGRFLDLCSSALLTHTRKPWTVLYFQ